MEHWRDREHAPFRIDQLVLLTEFVNNVEPLK